MQPTRAQHRTARRGTAAGRSARRPRDLTAPRADPGFARPGASSACRQRGLPPLRRAVTGAEQRRPHRAGGKQCSAEPRGTEGPQEAPQASFRPPSERKGASAPAEPPQRRPPPRRAALTLAAILATASQPRTASGKGRALGRGLLPRGAGLHGGWGHGSRRALPFCEEAWVCVTAGGWAWPRGPCAESGSQLRSGSADGLVLDYSS